MTLVQTWGWAVLATLASVSSVQAQAPSDSTTVDTIFDVFGGYATERQVSLVEDAGPPGTNRGAMGGANLSLRAQFPGERIVVGVSGEASTRRFSGFGSDWATGYGGAVTASSSTGRRVTWGVTQSFSHGPVNALDFFPGTGSTITQPIVDYRLSTERQLIFGARGHLDYKLSRRQGLALEAGYEVVDMPPALGDDRWRRWRSGGQYNYAATRYLTAYAGYSHSRGTADLGAGSDTPSEEIPVLHGIDVGVRYARALSISRRTRLSGTFGTSAIDSRQESLQYFLTGSAQLVHELGRTWQLQGTYDRGVRFAHFRPDPSLIDTVALSAQGRISNRTAVQFRGDLSQTSLPTAVGENKVDTVSASAQLRYGLLSRMALFAEYFVVESEWDDNALAALGITGSRFNRHGVQIGVSMGTALLGPRR